MQALHSSPRPKTLCGSRMTLSHAWGSLAGTRDAIYLCENQAIYRCASHPDLSRVDNPARSPQGRLTMHDDQPLPFVDEPVAESPPRQSLTVCLPGRRFRQKE